MGSEIPKQFLEVEGKPIIIWTLEQFQSMEDIDALAVVCIDGWQDELRRQAEQHSITKLRHIVKGGDVGQESIRLGLCELAAAHYEPDSVVLIHDAIRPLVSHDIVRGCIRCVEEHGFSVVVLPCNEAMLKVGVDGMSAQEAYPRDELRRTQTPQGGRLGDLIALHRKAAQQGVTNSVATCTLCVELGESVWFCDGSFENIKITTPEDIAVLRAILREREK